MNMINFFMWLCGKTGHLIQKEWHEKSEGVYTHCQICGTLLLKDKNRDGAGIRHHLKKGDKNE